MEKETDQDPFQLFLNITHAFESGKSTIQNPELSFQSKNFSTSVLLAEFIGLLLGLHSKKSKTIREDSYPTSDEYANRLDAEARLFSLAQEIDHRMPKS